MRKSYVTPSILLLPLQIVGPNAAVSPDGDGKPGMQPMDAKEGAFNEEDIDMSAGWFD